MLGYIMWGENQRQGEQWRGCCSNSGRDLNSDRVRKTKRKEWILEGIKGVGSLVCDQLIRYGR